MQPAPPPNIDEQTTGLMHIQNYFLQSDESPPAEFNLNVSSRISSDYAKLNNISYCFVHQLCLYVLCILNWDIVNSNYYVSSKHDWPSINSFNPVASFQSSRLCWACCFDRKDQKARRFLQTKCLSNSRRNIAAFYPKPWLCCIGSINIIKRTSNYRNQHSEGNDCIDWIMQPDKLSLIFRH